MRHTIVLLAILTLTSLQAFGRIGIMGPDVTMQLQGTVTAADDGSPIAGARVRVDPAFIARRAVAETRTNHSGRYSLSFEEEGCNHLFLKPLDVSANLFVGISRGIRCTNELQTLDFQLDRRPPQG